MSIIRAAQSNSFFNALLFPIFLTVFSPPLWAGDTAWPSVPIKDTVLQVDKGHSHKNSPAAKADNKKNKKADATAKKASNGYGKNG